MKSINYTIFGNVSKNKIDELIKKIKEFKIDLNDIEEKFVKGGGKGGQKINKTNNAVVLRYKPLNIIVKCQRERLLGVNRFIALRELLNKIEIYYRKNPEKRTKEINMILEGKSLSKKILEDVKNRVENIIKISGRPPKLAIVNYFENSPSTYYMNLKIKKCKDIGIETEIFMPENENDKKYFIDLIKKLSDDKNIDAIMVEKPLPDGFDDEEFWDALNPDKDVDALSSVNMGKLLITRSFDVIDERKFFVPQTAYATVRLMKYHNIDIEGKNIVIIGRSSIVGKPLACMLNLLNATVTVCHSKTKNLSEHLKRADIIVSAIGKARYVKADMIGENQIIMDVGTNIDENGKMCGDVDFESVIKKSLAVTPVPGGIGPVTLACLLDAVVIACEKRMGIFQRT